MRKALFSWVLVASAVWATTARAEGDDAPSTWMLQSNPYDAPAPAPTDTTPAPPTAASPAPTSPSVATMQNTPIPTAPIEVGTATVSFAVRTEAGVDIPHARVLMDGAWLTDALQGWAVSIPAGTHVFELVAPGYVSQEHPVVIHAGVVGELITVSLAPVAADFSRFSQPIEPWNARTVIFQPRTAAAPPASDGASDSARAGDPWMVTYVAGGTAIAALGLGTVLGISASNQIGELRQSCAPSCSASQVDSVRSKMTVADVAFGVGIVSGGVAVVWALTHPRNDLRDKKRVSFDLRGLAGQF